MSHVGGTDKAALHALMQGSAPDTMKLAMINADRALTENAAVSRVLLRVHYELVLEVAPGERYAVEQIVRDKIGSADEMDVPLDVSVGVGHSWHDAAH